MRKQGRRFVAAMLCSAALTTVTVTTASASEADSVESALDAVSDLLGNQTAVASVAQDADSAVVLVEDGVAIDVPSDPNDGIAIDSHTGSAVVITPTDAQLTDFEANGTTAVADGDGYSTVAQPLEDGDFRLAVILKNASAPNTLSYQLELDPGVQPVMRPDGGFDFVAPDGTTVGGTGAPWAIDAAGQPVPVSYSITGNTLSRTVLTSDATQFPVITNFCIFGRNPNGSCRGSRWVKPATQCAGWGLVGAAGVLATGGTAGPAVGVGLMSCAASQL